MAGVKGRSGRRPHLEDKDVKELLMLSTRILRQALTSDELTFEVKADLASKLYVKAMPSNIVMDSNQPVFQVFISKNETIHNRLTESNGIHS